MTDDYDGYDEMSAERGEEIYEEEDYEDNLPQYNENEQYVENVIGEEQHDDITLLGIKRKK